MGKTRKVREVAASDVKNAWHEYVDRVSRGREEVVVTRYGKPIMRLVPVEEPEGEPGLFGWFGGTVTFHGDVVAATGAAWEAGA